MRLNFNQRNTAHCTAVTCAKHFAFADSSGSEVKEVLLLVFGWVLLRVLDSFPGHIAIRCDLVRKMLYDCQIRGTAGIFESFHIMLSLMAIPMLVLGSE